MTLFSDYAVEECDSFRRMLQVLVDLAYQKFAQLRCCAQGASSSYELCMLESPSVIIICTKEEVRLDIDNDDRASVHSPEVVEGNHVEAE